MACLHSYVSSLTLSIVFFSLHGSFFGGSCGYLRLECELLVLGSEYTPDFYSLSDNELDARRFHEGIDQ